MIWPHCDGLFWPHPSRATIERAFGRPLRNVYGTSETGTLAESRLPHFEFQLIEDVVVVEPVDAAGRPTEPGQASDRIFVTNVVNRLLPLIRYEINDQLGLLDSRAVGPQTGRLFADVAGRSSDDFWYGGVRVAASALRALLTAEVDIEAYQVRQQPVGVTILFVSRTSVDTASLTDRIRKQLERAGLDGPVVEVTRVEHLRREGMVQKLRIRAAPTSLTRGGYHQLDDVWLWASALRVTGRQRRTCSRSLSFSLPESCTDGVLICSDHLRTSSAGILSVPSACRSHWSCRYRWQCDHRSFSAADSWMRLGAQSAGSRPSGDSAI